MIQTTGSTCCARTDDDRKDSGITIPTGLIQAERLVNIGFTAPAAVAARTVLETHLRALCEAAGCLPAKKRAGLKDLVQELKKAGRIDLPTRTALLYLVELGNQAAHGGDVFRSDVEDMIESVAVFVATFPVPAAESEVVA